MHHAVDDHGVDDASEIVDRQVAKHLHLPGVAHYFHHADVRPEREHEVARIEEADRLEAGLQVLRHVVREIGHQRDVAEGLEASRRALHRELAAFVDDVGFVRLQQVRGDLLRLLLDLLRAHVDGGRADGSAAAAVRAHPERYLAGIAVDDLYVFERQLQLVRGHLGERRLVSLPVAVRAGEDRHLAGGMHAHG